MRPIPEIIKESEHHWQNCADTEMCRAMSEFSVEDTSEAREIIEYGRFALKTKQYWVGKTVLKKAIDKFDEDYQIPDLLVDACFQIGDADGAIEAYRIARFRGIPLQCEAVRRVTRVALACGRINEIQPLLDDPTSASYQAECHSLVNQERPAFNHFEARRKAHLGDTPPLREHIQRAQKDGDRSYAAYLYSVALRSSSISEEELLEVLYEINPPNAQTAAFSAWRLLSRFPDSRLAKLEVGSNGLCQWGDAGGAATLLEAALSDGEFANYPKAPDRALRLATSCALYGSISQERLVEICSRLWKGLNNKKFSLLSIGFCVKSTNVTGRSLQISHKRPRVAVCVSGQLRNYKISWPTVRAALEGLDTTIFVSTWNVIGAGLGTGDSITRRLPAKAAASIPTAYQTRALFSERYPSTYLLFQESNDITYDECADYFETEFVRVNDESAFESKYDKSGLVHGGTLNQAKMYFGINDALSMKTEFERRHRTQFDAVIRIRPDLSVRKISEYDLISVSRSQMALSSSIRDTAVGDVLLVLSPLAAGVVEGMWSSMQAQNRFAIVPGASGAAAETALFENLCWNGVPVRLLRDTVAWALNSLSIESGDILKALRRDIAARSTLDEIDLIIASAVLEANGYDRLATVEQLRASWSKDSGA